MNQTEGDMQMSLDEVKQADGQHTELAQKIMGAGGSAAPIRHQRA